ncbi:MAG: xanthine dehydrogenase family protein molybdopterin-binding subunit [Chloroflexi bacterium]|nr:xanthine dehydrogenase family protein molybdopterin-binding subunit [Chloroflexota bacterium]
MESIVGKPYPRIDAITKATGEAQFAADLRLPHMLYGLILRSPHPHARVVKIDASRAHRVAAVKAVVTAADVPTVKFGSKGDQTILAVDRVRFVGEEVAAVAATSPDAAAEALDLISVEYELLPAVFELEEAMKHGAPRVHDVDNNVAHRLFIDRGDVDRGFSRADVVCEESFSTHAVAHCYVEPHACLAVYDSSGRLNIWSPDQGPFNHQANLSRVLKMPLSKIRVVQPHVGGGFGGKRFLPLYQIAALLSMKYGRPVQMLNSRKDELVASRPRVPAVVRLKMGATRDGVVTAKQANIISGCGAYSGITPSIMDVTAYRVDSLYRFKNIKTEATLVYSNTTPKGSFRGFGNPQGHFPVESMMDMLAEKLGLDPAEMRLRNVVHTGDVTAHGWAMGSCGISECIERAAASSAWSEKRKDRQPGRGIGMGCVVHVSGNRFLGDYDGSSAIVKVNEDGRVVVISGEGDVGQGANLLFAQIVGEVLGVDPSRIEVPRADTDISPFGSGAGADRVTFIGGNAVKLAAEDARRQLVAVAAQLLEANPADLEVANGAVFVKGSPGRSVSVPEVAASTFRRRGNGPIIGKGTYDPPSVVPDPVTKYGNSSAAYAFAAHVAEVDVDIETGQVKVLNLVAAHDLGRAINPLSAEGQIEGTVAQGLGFTLTEALITESGQVLNTSLSDYRVPTAMDMPSVAPILVESNDPNGPFGAKGLGEPGIAALVPAVVNAVYDAVGIRVTDLPVDPESLRRQMATRMPFE